MNRYNIVLLASTFACGLLYAGDAPKDVVEQEAEITAATIHVLSSPIGPVAPKIQESPKRPSSWINSCPPCSSMQLMSGHTRSSSIPNAQSYRSDFPGGGYIPR